VARTRLCASTRKVDRKKSRRPGGFAEEKEVTEGKAVGRRGQPGGPVEGRGERRTMFKNIQVEHHGKAPGNLTVQKARTPLAVLCLEKSSPRRAPDSRF